MFLERYLDHKDQVENIISMSMDPKSKGVFVFKHSTRCGVSRMVLNQFKKEWDLNSEYEVWILDLLKHRNISNELSSRFRVVHESPQLLYISGGEVKNHASHWNVDIKTVHNWLNA